MEKIRHDASFATTFLFWISQYLILKLEDLEPTWLLKYGWTYQVAVKNLYIKLR